MGKKSFLFQPIFYILIILYIILGYSTLGFGNKLAPLLFREDGYFENIAAWSLFISSIIIFIVFVRAFKTRSETGIHWIKLAVYFGFSFLFFFGAGEEISWGQRIFNIQTPDVLVEKNVQEELNIHNLDVFANNDIDSDDLFTLFWMFFIVFIPALALVWKRFEPFASKFVPIVYWSIGALFIFNYLFAKLAKIIYATVYSYEKIAFVQALQEIKESHYTFLLIFFSLFVLWNFNQTLNTPQKK
ncbi:MAG: hypothetical protein JNM46_03415 [Anaerolineales bacterium]|nr:hypothetical protein [Anaerolineales bacterium]